MEVVGEGGAVLLYLLLFVSSVGAVGGWVGEEAGPWTHTHSLSVSALHVPDTKRLVGLSLSSSSSFPTQQPSASASSSCCFLLKPPKHLDYPTQLQHTKQRQDLKQGVPPSHPRPCRQQQRWRGGGG